MSSDTSSDTFGVGDERSIPTLGDDEVGMDDIDSIDDPVVDSIGDTVVDSHADDAAGAADDNHCAKSFVSLSDWVFGICVVHFDLEYGQMIEATFPGDLGLSKSEESNICFLSFPDSNSHEEGDVSFSFRIRLGPKVDLLRQRYLVGFVLFRQARDASIPRGFMQKSVVLLTERPYYGLFRSVASILGEAYFAHGSSALEVAYSSMSTEWAVPRAGRAYSLPLLGSVLQFTIPFSLSPHMVDGEAPVPRSPHVASHRVISSSDGIDIYTLFRRQIPSLWRLWEIALNCEPLLVHSSDSPLACSAAVLAVVSLISPLKMYSDYRPFFTIHDSEFKEFSDPHDVPPVIIGTTNPYFLKAFSHWPNILYTGKRKIDRKSPSKRLTLRGIARASISSSPPDHLLEAREKPILSPDKALLRTLMSHKENPTHSRRASAGSVKMSTKVPEKTIAKRSLGQSGGPHDDHSPRRGGKDGEERTPTTGKGTVVPPSDLSDDGKGKSVHHPRDARHDKSSPGNASNSPNRILRRYFRELTERFLIPLESYVATLMPLDREVSPFRACPRMRAFRVKEFLQFVKQQRTFFTGREAKDVSLYRRFLASSNFKGWLRIRQQRTKKHLSTLYLEKTLTLDVQRVGETKSDVEIIDLYLRMKSQLGSIPKESPLFGRLQKKCRAVLSCLQEDLRCGIIRNEMASSLSTGSAQCDE